MLLNGMIVFSAKLQEKNGVIVAIGGGTEFEDAPPKPEKPTKPIKPTKPTKPTTDKLKQS